MQISQTTSALQAPQRVNSQSQALKKPAQVSLDQEKQQKSQQQTRFEVDQQSLALVQQNYQQNYQQQNQHGQQTQFGAQQTKYDQPSAQNQTAVSVYQSVSNLSERDNIQQIFGVDLLA